MVPNLVVAISMYLTIPFTNCTATGGFSALTRVKSEKQSAMVGGKVYSLMILSIASDITLEMDYDHLVDEFARFKKWGKKTLL